MNTLKIVLSALGGAAAGLSIGYLTAPRSGKQTREKIVDEFDSTKKALEEAANKKLVEAKELLNNTIETGAENGKEAIDKVKETVKIA